MRGRKRWGWALLCLALLAGGAWGAAPQSATPQPEEAPLVAVATQPWIAMLTSFIGGPNVKVTSLQEWNADGGLVRKRGKPALPPDGRVIALDSDDVQAAGLKGDVPNLRLLYAPFPARGADARGFLSDPAVLPFVAQRVLSVFSDWDPSNYPYYQRRLAEFQTRLASSVLAGRQVLLGVPVVDLTAFSGPLLQAARCRITRPDAQQLAALSRGSGLQDFLAARAAEGVTVVIDGGTPRAVKKFLDGRPGVFLFESPSSTQDYPAFLHAQYLALWQKIALRSEAGAAGKKK